MQDDPSGPPKTYGRKKYFIMAKITDKSGMVLSVGHSSYVKTHPLQKKYAQKVGLPKKEFLHAEMMAIIRLRPHQLRKVHAITVYRFHEDGRPALAKPCPICQSMIEAAGIKHVYYTTDEDCLDMDFEQYEQHRDEQDWI